MPTHWFEYVDAVDEAHFWSKPLSGAKRRTLGQAIAEREALPGAYADLFALTPAEVRDGIVLFTGDRATSAAARHIAGEEACRALLLLKLSDPQIAAAIGRATERVLGFLGRAEKSDRGAAFDRNPGAFCCGKCTVSVWRHITAGGLDRQDERLTRGIELLKSHRTPDGKFRRFPFWYAVSALVEAHVPAAAQELKRLRPILERAAGRRPSDDRYAMRRREIARRAMEVVG